jgi:aryl-alcohol dehydrogenase-like predicted oxidoreductase/enamine deaminase RidA (YjgF/YER057c/UK114 family)
MKSSIQLSDNLKIPRIIVGFWQIADMENQGIKFDIGRCESDLNKYVNAGFDVFDMADHYGSSEIILGKFKNKFPQKNIKLFTKWVPSPGDITRDVVRKNILSSLERMQQKSIDLLQFHTWYYPDPSWLDALNYLNELKSEGMIKDIGVTNFDSAHLRIALANGIPLVSNQVCHSIIDNRALGGLSNVCQKFGTKLIVYGTLAGGFLTQKWLNKPEPKLEELSSWSEMKYKRFIDVAGGWEVFQNMLNTIKKIADKHGVSIANISSRYALNNKNVASVIIGSRLTENNHINENKILMNIDLDSNDLRDISIAQAKMNPIPGDCGDEYRNEPFLTASGDLSDHIKSIPKVYKVEENIAGSKVFSGTNWEKLAGYSRANKIGNKIYVSGTTATHKNKVVGINDPSAQTHFIIDKIEAAINSLGAELKNIVRTRIFVNNIDDWEKVAIAHGERFSKINPANTLVEAKLVGKGYLVEIEAEAIID